ncbi:poly-gamma-glutamate synthase PgsB [Clostridium cochlearium]|uniref:poly-gamma-glutamate synthase PgsB n=1 Tax=Clostridium cochlearium TaxID=1494 RepID=UPI001EDFDF66|nr:poly-gamma-glutamate synthase PgsB [Clostridium cochlearium]MCG4581093.1 poly-gamma-glutamate synthase PgsB [Clostridium cochlearium]
MKKILIILIITYVCFLILEYRNNCNIRKAFKHIIHVNGTRGKSTTCRLIYAGIKEGGYRVFCKTTGTSPRIIDVNGMEEPIIRKGGANIREQIKILKKAEKQKADILVIECMAVNPELQYISQNKILNADISVVTNVRRDHLEEMGPTLEDVAKSLGNVMPKRGYFITGEKKFYDYYEELGESMSSKVILAKEISEDLGIDFKENISVALEVCKVLGIKEDVALRGMKSYKRDPGALKIYNIVTDNNTQIIFINGFAINDPDSTLKIFSYLKDKGTFNNKQIILMVNNRRDRPYRMQQHIEVIKKINPEIIWISGYYTSLMKNKLIKQGVEKEKIVLINKNNEFNLKNITKDTAIFGIGNIVGSGEKIIDYMEKVGDVIGE